MNPLTLFADKVSGVLCNSAYYMYLRYDSVMVALSASVYVRGYRVGLTRNEGDRLVRGLFV